jgi:alpha-ketoglutarate-dependent taurine dioxygenase
MNTLDSKNLLSTVVGSYILFGIGVVGIVATSKFLPSEPWKTLGFTSGSTLIAAGALSIFFEYFGRKSLVQEFMEKARMVVREQLDDFRAKSEHLKRSGIDDFGVIPPHKQIEEMLTNAKQSIVICKTWIPREDSSHLRAGLQGALASSKEDSTPDVKILCLDPDSPLVEQRFLDSHPTTLEQNAAKTQGRERIVEGLKEIIDACKYKQQYRRVEIRTYRNIPTLSLYSTENMAWIGWYWLGTEALGGPALLVSGKGDGNLGSEARENFKRIWAQSNEYAPDVEDTAFSYAERYISAPADPLLSDLSTTLSLDELRPMLEKWPGIKEYGRALVDKLRHEDFCIVKNFPFSKQDVVRKNQFLLLGCACGAPTDHRPPNQEYVCEVTPKRGLDRQVETYSEHDKEARLHTDSHYNDAPENFVAFLMERQAIYGGRNILLRFSALKKEMQSTPEGQHWFKYFQTHNLPSAKPSRYSERSAGEWEIIYKPIMVENGTAIRFREDTIRAAIMHLTQQNRPRNKQPDKELEKGLDFLTRLIYRSPDRRGVTLTNGQMLFVNNHTALHARTGFENLDRMLLRIRFNS